MTKADLEALLDSSPAVQGEGPFLLLTLSMFEGLLLKRFPTESAAQMAAANYTGPAHWIFEVTRQIEVVSPEIAFS